MLLRCAPSKHQKLKPDATEVDRDIAPVVTVVCREPDVTICQSSVEMTRCACVGQQGRREVVQRIGQTTVELGPGSGSIGAADVRLGVIQL
jgi:hypothetical protein